MPPDAKRRPLGRAGDPETESFGGDTESVPAASSLDRESRVPRAGLCWIACGVSHCACCPLASEVAK